MPLHSTCLPALRAPPWFVIFFHLLMHTALPACLGLPEGAHACISRLFRCIARRRDRSTFLLLSGKQTMTRRRPRLNPQLASSKPEPNGVSNRKSRRSGEGKAEMAKKGRPFRRLLSCSEHRVLRTIAQRLLSFQMYNSVKRQKLC